MSLSLKDRVKQVTNTRGTGTLTLVSTPSGFRSFGSCLSNGDTTYYCIESGSQWEVGIGTYNSDTLARTTVLVSSNANALVNITASRSFVFISYVADKATYKDGSGRIVSGAAGIIFSDATVQTTAATTPDLAPYAPLASPTFTGVPAATTAAVGTNTTQIATTQFVASAVATKADLVGGLVPSAQLPSYVDDVVEAANLAAFPGTGETGKIYVAVDTGYTYRWSGSIYVRINEVDLSSYLTSSVATATYLPLAGGTLTGDLKFTDALYDIGKSGATRPRDAFFSRNLTVGGSITVAPTSTGVRHIGEASSPNSVGWKFDYDYIYMTYAGSNVIKFDLAGTHLFRDSIRFYTVYGGYTPVTVRHGSSPFVDMQKWENSAGTTLSAITATGGFLTNDIVVRNGTTATQLDVNNTFTSTTSFETFRIKANAGAAYQIGSAIGSAGGANRALSFGHWNSGGTFTASLSVNTTANQVAIGTMTAGYNVNFSTGIYGLNLNSSTPHVTIWSGDGSAFGSSFSGYPVFMVGQDVGTLSGYGIGSYSKFAFSTLSTTGVPQICLGNPAGFTGVNGALGTTGTAQGGEFTVASGHGTNNAGASIWLMAGRSTGSGLGGTVYIGTSTTGSSGSTRNSNLTLATFAPTAITITPGVATSGSPTAFTITDAAHTTMTASTEATSVNFNLSSTKQFATGAISTQRAMLIQAPTYSFVGASTITTASTLAISGPPIAGTNATITKSYALNVESGFSRFGGEINITNASSQTLRIAMDTNNPIISSATTRMIVGGTAIWLRTDGGVSFVNSSDSEMGTVTISGFNVTMQSNTNGSMTLKVPTSANSNQGANAVNVIGQTALSSSINVIGGGAVNLTGGNGASASVGDAYGGDVVITGGVGYGTGRQGRCVILSPITNTSTGITDIRNGTNAQTLRVANTWTSSTSYETLNLKGKASANFEIGPENGSAGGTLRGLTIGGYSAGTTTIAPWLSFTNTGAATFAQELNCSNTTTVTNANIHVERYGASISSVRFRKAQGTSGSPTQALSADIIGLFGSYGYHDGSAFHTTAGAYIGFVAAENITSTGHGSLIRFNTTPTGSTTSATRVQIESSGVTTFYKLACQSSEPTSTPSGTTQTITLDSGNHQTLTLTSSTGNVTATLTVPSNVSSGTIIVKQHGTTPRDITWAVSAGTFKWMGTEPTWSSDAINDIRIVSWRYDGSVMYLMSTDVAT